MDAPPTIIDSQAVTRLASDISPEVAKEIVEAYINQVGEFIPLLTTADMVTRGRIAHTLKGDSPLVGAVELTRLAEEMDAEYKKNNELTDDQCQQLAHSCRETIEGLSVLLADM